MINKEYGSDFPHILSMDSENVSTDQILINSENINLHFSGRSSLYHIIVNGINCHGWERILIPSYYCHEVVDFIKVLPLDVEYYEITPFKERKIALNSEKDNLKSAIVIVDFFGLDKIDHSGIQNAFIIEDVTHNLNGLMNNGAHYTFGSLRKTLPIPVGGFSFSSTFKFEVELNAPNENVKELVELRNRAMVLKSSYLQGENEDKETYRNLYAITEEKFREPFTTTELPASVLSQIKKINLSAINVTKTKNLDLIKSILIKNDVFSVLTSVKNEEFALSLKFKNIETRDSMKFYLINNKIYPIVLWPNQFTQDNLFLQDILLFIHVDFRYSLGEVKHIAKIINNYHLHV